MDKSLFEYHRKSHMEMGGIFFWTATINKWKRLLQKDEFKDVIIDSLQYLSDKEKVDVFGFILMPNHIHLIWRVNELNGKESPQGSLLKYTAHMFQKMLLREEEGNLLPYKIKAANKKYEFWQRDSLAIPLFTRKVALQKLNYIHKNPLAKHWRLVNNPCDYKYSSAKYYESGKKNFHFLKNLWVEF